MLLTECVDVAHFEDDFHSLALFSLALLLPLPLLRRMPNARNSESVLQVPKWFRPRSETKQAKVTTYI